MSLFSLIVKFTLVPFIFLFPSNPILSPPFFAEMEELSSDTFF